MPEGAEFDLMDLRRRGGRADAPDGRAGEYGRMAYWFCLTHMAVEPDEGCAHAERLGPFEDQECASAALERARQRSKAWDTDPKWND